MPPRRTNMRGFDELERRVAELNSKRVHVGVLQAEGAGPKRGPDGRAEKLSLVEIAAIHEFGSPAARVPERSFIRRTFNEQRTEIAMMAGKLGRAVVLGQMTPDQALNLLGLKGATEIKKTITTGEGVPPPLSEATIEKRRRMRSRNRKSNFDRPLVDTGQLVNSITHAVGPRKAD